MKEYLGNKKSLEGEEYPMNELQKEILKVFKEFQNICSTNNLRYFAIGGTCLGAIRHKGFIPWDDDLDVVMPFEDYEKFRYIASKYLKAPYQLLDFEEVQHCRFLFLKMHNSETTFIEEDVKQFPERYTGVYIDIMPVVGLPKHAGFVHKFKCFYCIKLNLARRFKHREKRKLLSKIIVIFASMICVRKPFNYYSKKFENLISKYKFGESEQVLFPWRIPVKPPYKNVFPYFIFKESRSVPFEDTTILVPREYDSYLTMDFGDYMKLPPEEERISRHTAECIDLRKPYREYRRVER